MNIKTFIKTTILVFPLAVAAMPPDNGTGDPHEHKLEWMTKQLQLTPDQATKVANVFQAQRTKFEALHEETNTELKGILTPEQVTKWEQLKAQRKEHQNWRKKLEDAVKKP